MRKIRVQVSRALERRFAEKYQGMAREMLELALMETFTRKLGGAGVLRPLGGEVSTTGTTGCYEIPEKIFVKLSSQPDGVSVECTLFDDSLEFDLDSVIDELDRLESSPRS